MPYVASGIGSLFGNSARAARELNGTSQTTITPLDRNRFDMRDMDEQLSR